MSSKIEIEKICEFCGQEFIARTNATKYCDHNCARLAWKKRKKEEKQCQKLESGINYNHYQSNDTINNKDILSVQEAASLMSVGRATIHRYCVAGDIPCKKINRKIFIRRKDIEALFENTGTYIVTKYEKEPLTDFYSVPEIIEKYGFSPSFTYKIINEKNIPKMDNPEHYGRPLYSKKHVDRHFKSLVADKGILEWYSVEEIMEKYDMTKHAVHSLVSIEKVPRKKEGWYTRYSKEHIDKLLSKRIPDPEITSWYTMKDILKKYNLKQKYVSNLIYKYPVPKVKKGAHVLLSQVHFDKLIKELGVATEFYTVEEAMEKYNLTRDSLDYRCKKYGIPKIKEGIYIRIPQKDLDNSFLK